MRRRTVGIWIPRIGVVCLVLAMLTAWTGSSAPEPTNWPKQLKAMRASAPELLGSASDWLNTEGQALNIAPGKVHVVHFWTFGCINCKRNLPAYERWARRFADQELVVIGIHTPETDREKQLDNVRAALREERITYPVLVDGQLRNWYRWKQRWWPTVYLVDKSGKVRYAWYGELEWEDAGGTRIMEGFLQDLLREPGPNDAPGADDTRLTPASP